MQYRLTNQENEMTRIYKKMNEAKLLLESGLISKKEYDQMMQVLNIELMGCDSL